jgi:hypothetical protein
MTTSVEESEVDDKKEEEAAIAVGELVMG